MAEDGNKEGNSQAAGVDGPPVKCPECVPGLPGWMATFSDLVTLLLTFFVLLLSFAKTETAKYEAALGSIRNAFGGNVLEHGEVIERGKSPDDKATMLESEQPVRPFPIDFLTMEGILNKHEINRASDEDLFLMREDLSTFGLTDYADIYETTEGIMVRIKEKIYFKKGSTGIEKMQVESFEKMIKLLKNKDWVVFVEAHSQSGESSATVDALGLSSLRAQSVTRSLVKRGVRPNRITTVFYGSTRPAETNLGAPEYINRRVEFIIRKNDLRKKGHKVPSQNTR